MTKDGKLLVMENNKFSFDYLSEYCYKHNIQHQLHCNCYDHTAYFLAKNQ